VLLTGAVGLARGAAGLVLVIFLGTGFLAVLLLAFLAVVFVADFAAGFLTTFVLVLVLLEGFAVVLTVDFFSVVFVDFLTGALVRTGGVAASSTERIIGAGAFTG
jgi:hypothetical protein